MKAKIALTRTLLGGLGLALVLGVMPSVTTLASAAEPITLTFNWDTYSGITLSPVFPFRPGGRYERLLRDHTNGRVKLDIKERLYSPRDSVLAAADGRIDMAWQCPVFASGTYPLLDFGALPGFFSDLPNCGYEWSDAICDPRLLAALEKYTRPHGFLIIGGAPSLPGNAIFANKPLAALKDFRGTKIRGAGWLPTLELRALGASAVSISVAEVTEALTRGTVDAAATSMNFGLDQGYHKICKYVNIWPFTMSYPMVITINAKVFDSLPKDLQDGMKKAGSQLAQEIGTNVENLGLVYEALLHASECQVIKPTKGEIDLAAKRMPTVFEAWLKKAGPIAPEVLRIAAEYARGPARGELLSLIK